MEAYARIGARLRAARTALGYTQQQLADALGVAASTYSRYEAGKQKIEIPELETVAALLGLPIRIPGGDPDPPPPLDADLAHRVADLVAAKLPAIVRAAVADEMGRAGQAGRNGATPDGDGTVNAASSDQARSRLRPRRWPARALLPAAS